MLAAFQWPLYSSFNLFSVVYLTACSLLTCCKQCGAPWTPVSLPAQQVLAGGLATAMAQVGILSLDFVPAVP